jgi:hypothetical protein
VWPDYIDKLGRRRLSGFALCAAEYCVQEREKAEGHIFDAYADMQHPINHPSKSKDWWNAYRVLRSAIPLTGTWMRYGDVPLCVRCARELVRDGDQGPKAEERRS